MAELRPETFAELSVFGVDMRMVVKCVMGQRLQYTAYCRGWVGTGKPRRSSGGRASPLETAGRIRKLVAPRDQARTEACRVEKKRETDVTT